MDFPHAVIVALVLLIPLVLYFMMAVLDDYMRPHEKQENWGISPETEYPVPTVEANDPDKKWYQL